MEPLANRLRPRSFNEVVGQNHLVGNDGILRKMIEQNKFMSFVLYGPPGSGKTTIANIFAVESKLEYYSFNAATDNKKTLQDILDVTNFNNILLIVDEVHRMNKDIQDVLLPYLENGKVVMIGLTTNNPYHSINYAIRSRLNIYELKPFSKDDIKKVLLRALKISEIDFTINEEAFNYIISYSNNDIRSALNLLETSTLYLKDGSILTKTILQKSAAKTSQSLDKNSDNFYHLLSALQKSIRGSDVDASVHYLAKLIKLGDLKTINRRLLIIAYEDIGLANPQMGPKVLSATKATEIIGFPEASIILGTIVVDMALSPKSNTGYVAISNALNDLENINTGIIPDFLNNNLIRVNKELYELPHNLKGSIDNINYLPKEINDKIYYKPKNESKYENALTNRLSQIDKIKNKKR